VIGDYWTIHRWWVPMELESSFAQEWRLLAEMLVREGLMESVSLFADEDEHEVRWTLLRWSSQSAWRAWRADVRHRSVEDGVAAVSDRVQVHHLTTVLTVGHR
jgi:heme-degrading monooxygenase HmoA